MTKPPLIWWVRRDFRLCDNLALSAAVATGHPVIALFVHDECSSALKPAPAWRLNAGLECFAQRVSQAGSRLVLRRGAALPTLLELVRETGAVGVYWNRLYDPQSIARDAAVKAALQDHGIQARSFAGHVLFEPWTVETGQGGVYRVYSPFQRAVWDRPVPDMTPAPATIPAPATWPKSDDLGQWALGAGMRRGAANLAHFARVGEISAQTRLADFAANKATSYKAERDRLDMDATSGLSEYLSLGEITPVQCYHAVRDQIAQGDKGAIHFYKEILWREFAYHLLYHTPHITTDNWRSEWDGFPWNTDADTPQVLAWKQGRTGIAVIDAAMRELYITGRMHNRARMLVASYLTKHMMVHWKIGMDWFENCLVDWDPASNAMGWQWVAGSGPDAAPYFRVFNPDTQAEKFDAQGRYSRTWLAEGTTPPTQTALRYYDSIPIRWGLSPQTPYPAQPIIGLSEGRKRALAAYETRNFKADTST
jgi:deoxyribodipyrimidine photo-lyase